MQALTTGNLLGMIVICFKLSMSSDRSVSGDLSGVLASIDFTGDA